MPPFRVLCFASYFLPGFKSGGPVRSLSNLIASLGGEFDFRVVTRDRDLGDSEPYPGIVPGAWSREGGVSVQYLARPYSSPAPIRELLRGFDPHLLYFNSFMDPHLSILPMLYRRLNLVQVRIPVLMAPRGEFSPGALSMKRTKKAVYLRVAKALGIYRDITWHATSESESHNIRAWVGPAARIVLAPNLPPPYVLDNSAGLKKQRGSLRVIFLSRIDRMKNLDGALRMLAGVKARVDLDIYGTREDPGYWEQCVQLMRGLPHNVRARYCGTVLPDKVIDTFTRYDVFLFPTLGENFGHVILESLLGGCPVMVSDRSPWRNLEQCRAGIDLPLDHPEGFSSAIEKFADMDAVEFGRWSQGARDAGLAYCRDRDLARPAREMFELAIRSAG